MPDNIGTVEMTVISKRHIISDQPSGDAPRLMLIFPHYLSQEGQHNVSISLREVLDKKTSIVIPHPCDVYQLVGGRWISLDAATELEDAPVPKKINFREFT